MSRVRPCDPHNDMYLDANGKTYMKGDRSSRIPCTDVHLPHNGKTTREQEALLALRNEPGFTRDLERHKLVGWSIPRRVYIGIGSEKQFGCPDERMVSLIRGKLGAGSLGTVYTACKGHACKYVIKVQLIGLNEEQDPGSREVAISQLIESRSNTRDMIAPVLGSRVCRNLFLTLYDTYDMDGEQLGAKQFEAQFNLSARLTTDGDVDFLLYTERQLRQFFVLARRLTALGVAHGDLKPDNYLYKVYGDELVIADLGFAGSYTQLGGKYRPRWGFSRNDRHCPDVMSPEAARFANMWQMLFRFATYTAVIVAIGDSRNPPLQYCLFEGLSKDFHRDLPDEAAAVLQRECKSIRPDVAASARQMADERRNQFSTLLPYFLTFRDQQV